MTIAVSAWAFPVCATVVIWAIVLMWPASPRRGDYDFSGAFEALLHIGCGVVATLVVWLIFFIVMWAGS
jgi:hypothetical protein